MVPGLANFSYEEKLEAMELPSLAYRKLRGCNIEVDTVSQKQAKLFLL